MDKKNKEKCVTEVFARVTGFFRPVQDWNPGKQAEFKDRRGYDIMLTKENRGEWCTCERPKYGVKNFDMKGPEKYLYCHECRKPLRDGKGDDEVSGRE